METFFSALTALFTGLASLGIFLARKQLRYDAWVKAQDIFNDDEFRKARTALFACLDTPGSSCTIENAEIVCRKMNELCHLAEFLGERRILINWGNPLAKAWHLLGAFVDDEIKQSNWEHKWRAFQKIGKKALEREPDLKGKPIPKISDFEVLFQA